MSDYEIVDTNADNIGGCGICRYKSSKNVSVRRNTLEEEIGASQRLIAGGWLTGSEGLLESFPISRNQL
jgi:hypothetical protein